MVWVCAEKELGVNGFIHMISPSRLDTFTPGSFSVHEFSRSLDEELHLFGMEAVPFMVSDYNSLSLPSGELPHPGSLAYVLVVTPRVYNVIAANLQLSSIRNIPETSDSKSKSARDIYRILLKSASRRLTELPKELSPEFFFGNKILPNTKNYINFNALLEMCGVSYKVDPSEFTSSKWLSKLKARYLSNKEPHSFFLHREYGGWAAGWGILILTKITEKQLKANGEKVPTYKGTAKFTMTDDQKKYVIVRNILDGLFFNPLDNIKASLGTWKDVRPSWPMPDCSQLDCETNSLSHEISPPKHVWALTALFEARAELFERVIDMSVKAERYDKVDFFFTSGPKTVDPDTLPLTTIHHPFVEPAPNRFKDYISSTNRSINYGIGTIIAFMFFFTIGGFFVYWCWYTQAKKNIREGL